MRGKERGERRISAQLGPVSGMERAASRTTVPPILLAQNRHPHRRSRGRCAVLDPARSMPGAAPVFRRSGGDDGTSAAYRRASGRACMERRQAGNRADQGRTGSRAGRAGTAAQTRLTGAWGRRQASLSAIVMIAGEGTGRGRRTFSGGWRLRQDQRNGVMPCGHRAVTSCLHILFSKIADSAIWAGMAPYLAQRRGFWGFVMAPSPCSRWCPSNRAGRLHHVR